MSLIEYRMCHSSIRDIYVSNISCVILRLETSRCLLSNISCVIIRLETAINLRSIPCAMLSCVGTNRKLFKDLHSRVFGCFKGLFDRSLWHTVLSLWQYFQYFQYSYFQSFSTQLNLCVQSHIMWHIERAHSSRYWHIHSDTCIKTHTVHSDT